MIGVGAGIVLSVFAALIVVALVTRYHNEIHYTPYPAPAGTVEGPVKLFDASGRGSGTTPPFAVTSDELVGITILPLHGVRLVLVPDSGTSSGSTVVLSACAGTGGCSSTLAGVHVGGYRLVVTAPRYVTWEISISEFFAAPTQVTPGR